MNPWSVMILWSSNIWLKVVQYQNIFAISQSLPGSASTKMRFCIKTIHSGFCGGTLGFLFFWGDMHRPSHIWTPLMLQPFTRCSRHVWSVGRHSIHWKYSAFSCVCAALSPQCSNSRHHRSCCRSTLRASHQRQDHKVPGIPWWNHGDTSRGFVVLPDHHDPLWARNSNMGSRIRS